MALDMSKTYSQILIKQYEAFLETNTTLVRDALTLYGGKIPEGAIIPFAHVAVMTGELVSATDEGVSGEASLGFSVFSLEGGYNRKTSASLMVRVTAKWAFNAPFDASNPALSLDALDKLLASKKEANV